MPLVDLPQTNKQHAVPQNIMDVEFRLIGDLTMRQFAYLIICGGIAYFASVSPLAIFKWPIVIFFSLLGLGLAFVPIQERGLDEWIVNFFKSIYSPTLRIWRKEPVIPSAFMYENLNVVKQELITLAPTSSRRKLEEYLEYQKDATPEDPLDIPEREYIQKVREAFANYSPVAAPTSVITEPDVSSLPPMQFPEMPLLPKEEPVTEEKTNEDVAEPVSETPKDVSAPSIQTPGTTVPITPDVKLESPVVTVPKQPETPAPVNTPQTSAVEKPKRAFLEPVRDKIVKPVLQKTRSTINSAVTLAPITPDMHAGRRFTNLLPNQGELVLPIRGEKVLKTAEEVNIEGEIKDKTDRLQQLLSQIKRSDEFRSQRESKQVPVMPSSPPTPPIILEEKIIDNKEAEQVVETLRVENERLTGQINKLKDDMTTSTSIQKKEELDRLQNLKDRTASDYERLKRQILDLQNKLKEKESTQGPANTLVTNAKPNYIPTATIDTKPNIVSGIVKNSAGNVLEGILLIIKNQKNEAVRAFKTNSVGKFNLTTPLANGLYTIEVSPTKDIGTTFDIISIEAKGEPIPPIEIIGK